MAKITKKTGIMDVVQKHPKTAEVFFNNGMHCLGCAAAHFENIEEGCMAHGINADKLVSEINEVIEKEEKEKKSSSDRSTTSKKK